ncbi:transcription antitermination factor NusB [Prevotella sp. HUN102]|uniref:transcription antitermination factor NusB n=1 Tax=Prevotella sp. HUN102 TaxID=1392486 RepID=UPI000567E611|nr:transcription antitermination factor NusB [Prevotella sp. HUN102]
MINRDLIRIKVVQLTYAYYQNGDRNMDKAEKELLFSLSKAYSLYNYLLSLIVSITQEERHRVEILTNRAKREGTEAPSQRFAYNKFAVQLEENKQLNLYMEGQQFRWEDDMESVRKLCDQIEQSVIYKEYMESEDDSYEAHRELWRKLYRTLIQENEDLDAVLEEKSLYWNDDKEIVDTFVIKTIKRFEAANKSNEELLPEFKDEEDREFAVKLFRSTILNADQYQRYMSETSRNWDFSRLAYMDVVIMQIAIAEMLTFPNIPVSVTINEYVELAKLYSTPRSGGYINGMLDTIARHLIDTRAMLKQMPEPRQRRPRDDRRANGHQGNEPRFQNEGGQQEAEKEQE